MVHTLTPRLTQVLLAAALATSAIGCGNSKGSNGRLLGGSTAAGITTTLNLPPGEQPPGPVTTVVSPARGTYAQAGRIPVEGYVDDVDGAGITQVLVNGLQASFDPASGTFSGVADLEPGLNTVVVESYDALGRRSERQISLLAGTLLPEDQPLTESASLRLTDLAFDVIEPQIGDGILAQKPQLAQQVLATPVQDAKLKAFDFAGVTAQVDAVAGGMSFDVRIRDVRLDIEASATVLLVFNQTLRGTVTASEVRLRGSVSVDVQNGQPRTSVSAVTADLTGFAVPDWARNEYRAIRDAFQQAFADSTRKSVEEGLAKAFASSTTRGTVSRTIMDTPLEFDYALTRLTFDADGATAVFGSNVRPLNASYGAIPGSVAVGGKLAELVGGGAGPNMAVAVHQDAVNRALHAAWRAGLLKLQLDQARMNQLLPQFPTDMTTTALVASVPQLGQFLPPGLPFTLEIEGMLPPVVQVRTGTAEQLVLNMGDLRVRMFVIHPTEGPVLLTHSIYSVRLPVSLSEDQGQVRLVAAGNPEVRVDVEGASLPGTEQVLEQLTQPQAIQVALAQAAGVPIPTVQGLTAQGLTFSTWEGNLVVMGSLVRKP